MSKFNVVLLALFAITFQASNGASFHNPNNNILRETISAQNIQLVIDDINKVIFDLSSRLSTLLHAISKKFTELKAEANLPAVIDNLKEEINHLSEGSAVSEICSSSTWYEVKLLEKFVKEATLSCRFNLDSEVLPLRQQLEALTVKLQGFLEQINKDVFKCFRKSNDSFEQFAECMKDTVVIVQQQLEDVRDVVTEVLNAFEVLLPVLEDKMAQCVNEAKKDVEEKAQTIVEDLKECTQVQTPLTKRMLCWPNVDIEICNEW